MTNVGEGNIMADQLDGQLPIRSQGLSVFVGDEKITIYEGKWRNAEGVFDTLEEAVRNALPRWGGIIV
jgi:hypothetical protein